jgi:hypothetical protein
VKKIAQSPLALRMAEGEEKRIPSKGWAVMIRKAYEVDPLVCPKCRGRCARSHASQIFRWWTGSSTTSI